MMNYIDKIFGYIQELDNTITKDVIIEYFCPSQFGIDEIDCEELNIDCEECWQGNNEDFFNETILLDINKEGTLFCSKQLGFYIIEQVPATLLGTEEKVGIALCKEDIKRLYNFAFGDEK